MKRPSISPPADPQELLMNRNDRLAWCFGLFAASATILTIGDPGMTCDEPLDILPGRKYVETLIDSPTKFLDRDVVTFVYRDNAEHPPLGRWLLGLASKIGGPFETMAFGPDPLRRDLIAGRLAPALAFAALVGLIVQTTGRRFGAAAACASGFSLLIMPRMFAHAHFGALDTFVSFFWTLGLLSFDRAIAAKRPIPRAAIAGFFLGLALLTKIQGWLLPPIAFAWAFARLKIPKAVGAWFAWFVGGIVLFFAGWPWLWFDTFRRIQTYFSTGIHRAPIRVLYFGRVFLDRDVPWHYPWVYFVVVVPIGVHALGAWGVWRGIRERKQDPFLLLCFGTILYWLLIFSANAPVYDGERLFSPAFPFWAILAGAGFGDLWEKAGARRFHRAIRIGLSFLLAIQAQGVVRSHPFELSYYNALVGGLAGAERLGLEPTYWGDAVDRRFLSVLERDWKPGETVAMSPTLAPGQGLANTPTALLRRGIAILDEEAAENADWVVLWRRSTYWKPAIVARVQDMELVAENRREGVWLARLYRSTKPKKQSGSN